MSRLYVGFRTVGKPEQILDRITKTIRNLKLTKIIPIVKLERRPRGEFYVFLAVDGVGYGNLPREIIIALKTAGLANPIWPIESESVKTMVSNSEIETHALNTLMYRPLFTPTIEDPFDLLDQDTYKTDYKDQELANSYDKLLYWLSFAVDGSWETFVRACEILKLTNDFNRPQSILRKLILLGHIKCSNDGTKWFVCPTILIRRPAQNTWYMCGQRSPKLIKQLSRFPIETILQPNSHGPSCILIKDVSEDDLSGLSFDFLSDYTVKTLPTINKWKESLNVVEKLNTSTFNLSIWSGKDYLPCNDFYERDGEYFGLTGLYRLTRKFKESQSYSLPLFFDKNDQRWYKGDWYGLRFLANRAVISDEYVVLYDFSHKTLLIPQDERWPLIFEQSLVQTSGLLPSKLENGWLIYKDISSEMLKEFGNKLNFIIKEVS